jgi:hypothetical protein
MNLVSVNGQSVSASIPLLSSTPLMPVVVATSSTSPSATTNVALSSINIGNVRARADHINDTVRANGYGSPRLFPTTWYGMPHCIASQLVPSVSSAPMA